MITLHGSRFPNTLVQIYIAFQGCYLLYGELEYSPLPLFDCELLPSNIQCTLRLYSSLLYLHKDLHKCESVHVLLSTRSGVYFAEGVVGKACHSC